MSAESIKKAEEFLALASQFKLGSLVTESSHPLTRELSYLAVNAPVEAIKAIKTLDDETVKLLSGKTAELCLLKASIRETFNAGHNVYFCGCGATGRLSLTIETIWRQVNFNNPMENRVFSFMSGGDVALIRSIENFEDYPQYGAKQLMEAGFMDGDLLIATTEGGETPFVIGAVEKAAEISSRKPYFLYCNPDDILSDAAERSRNVINNQSIVKINLTVGPMAVTGSTRMQSSTILLAAAGIPLFFYNDDDKKVDGEIKIFTSFWNSADISFISDFLIAESEIYKRGDYLLYETDNNLGITVITDTTERSPTFSLYPFENLNETDPKMSLCYLYLPSSPVSENAWSDLLRRAPRTLEWPEINGIASRNRLLGFDFSAAVLMRRESFKKNSLHTGLKLYLKKAE